MRSVTDLPIAVGFGISTRAQVLEVWRYADAAVVGSAVVAEIEKLATAPDLVKQIGGFVQALLPQEQLVPSTQPRRLAGDGIL
jgi:tryptophan synthase alpha chain